MLAELGATVIDSDELAREVVKPGSRALASIAAKWADVLQPDGSLDRAALRSRVFLDPEARDALNAIVHPEVRRRRDEMVLEARARGDKVVVAAIPLLFETGLHHEFDRVILVDAPDDVRLARLMRRSGLSVDDARRMMAAQMPSSLKRPSSDIVIENDASLEELRGKVRLAWEELSRISTS